MVYQALTLINVWTVMCTYHEDIKGQGFFHTNLEKSSKNSFYIFLLDVNFKNIAIRLHIFYILHTHVKFRSNHTLYTI